MEYPIKAQRYIAPGATVTESTTVNSRSVRPCPKTGAQGPWRAEGVIGTSLRFAKSYVVQPTDSLAALRPLPWGGETLNHGDRHEFALIHNSSDLRLHLPMVLDR
jgi:hypothetical protein